MPQTNGSNLAEELQAQRDALLGSIQEGLRVLRDRTDGDHRAPDDVDELGDAQDVDVLLRQIDVQTERFYATDSSLAQLRSGSDVVVCIDCGARIPDDRIRAVMGTRRCVCCASSYEKHTGHPGLRRSPSGRHVIRV